MWICSQVVYPRRVDVRASVTADHHQLPVNALARQRRDAGLTRPRAGAGQQEQFVAFESADLAVVGAELVGDLRVERFGRLDVGWLGHCSFKLYTLAVYSRGLEYCSTRYSRS